MKAMESFITKIWRFLKKQWNRVGVGRIPLMSRIFDFAIELIIRVLSWQKHMILAKNENPGTKLRYLIRWYEYDSVIVCKNLIKPGMTVFDIGADIGYYTKLFSESVGKHGTVWAFEPNPDSYELLSKNTERGIYKNVILMKSAVSDINGEARFFAMSASGKHGFYDTSRINEGVHQMKEIHVPTVCIDEFLKEKGIPGVSFVKMDIEGAEPRALAGMKKTVANSKNLAMMIELNSKVLRLAGIAPALFLDQLRYMGLEIRAIGEKGVLEKINDSVFRRAEEGYVNLLCFKGNIFHD